MSLSRYDAYTPTSIPWLGSLPSHWCVAPMKRLIEIQNGADHKHIETTEGVPVIGSGGPFTFASEAMYSGESVLLGRKGTIDRPIYINGDFWTVDTMYWSIVRPDTCGRFAYYVATTIPFGYYSTSTALPSMTKSALNAHLVPFPELTEQESIAAFLDHETAKIDALIAEQEKLIALLAEKRQATISHAVTRGLNPDVPMKDSGVAWLGEVPAHWNILPLKLIAVIGNGSTPNRDNPDYWESQGFPWLNSSVVNMEEVSEAAQFVTDLALKECHLPIVKPPALLVGITGQGKTRGMATLLKFTATLNQHLAYIKPDENKLSEKYLIRLFEALYQHLRTESEGAGSTKGAITCEQLGNLRVPMPALEEQIAIASLLDQETDKINQLSTDGQLTVNLLKERRSALIAAAVTGQIDVRNFVAEAS